MREKETDDNKYRPLETYLKYVDDVAGAEAEFADKVSSFPGGVADGWFVEMNHDPDPSKNKPCVGKKIIDGKVESGIN